MRKIGLLITTLFLLTAAVGAQEWYMLTSPTGANITGILMVSPDTGFMVTSDGHFLRTNDKCQSWSNLEIPGNLRLESLCFLDSKNGWVCGYNGAILATADGGLTWSNQSWQDSNVVFFDIEMINKDTGLAIGMNPTPDNRWNSIAVKTTNGGAKWSELDQMGLAYSEIRYFKPARKIYFMSIGRLNVSTDGAKSWRSLNTVEGRPTRTFSIYGNTGIMGGLKGTMAYSNDSGKTWFKRDSPEPNQLVSSVLINANDGLLGGSDGFMLSTSNGGRSWERETLPESFFIMDMYAIDDRVYAVGSGGKIAFKQLVRIKN